MNNGGIDASLGLAVVLSTLQRFHKHGMLQAEVSHIPGIQSRCRCSIFLIDGHVTSCVATDAAGQQFSLRVDIVVATDRKKGPFAWSFHPQTPDQRSSQQLSSSQQSVQPYQSSPAQQPSSPQQPGQPYQSSPAQRRLQQPSSPQQPGQPYQSSPAQRRLQQPSSPQQPGQPYQSSPSQRRPQQQSSPQQSLQSYTQLSPAQRQLQPYQNIAYPISPDTVPIPQMKLDLDWLNTLPPNEKVFIGWIYSLLDGQRTVSEIASLLPRLNVENVIRGLQVLQGINAITFAER